MATDAAEVVGSVRRTYSVKVHRMMCTELMSLVDRILIILPKIEEVRPRCPSGIQALCLLNSGIEKASGLLQSCSDGSKLYLAVTGDAAVSRFKRTTSILEQSLSLIQDMVPAALAAKVHRMMCTELMSLVDRISIIFPKIEEAIPRCPSVIQAQCFLNSGIEKANGLLQSCSDGSKLYLVATGDSQLSRFRRTRSLLMQSLSLIQDMVPVALAAEFCPIVDDLFRAAFVLDPSEEEAGTVLKELLQQGTSASDSTETSEIRSLQTAASRLHITSPRAILIEKRSIKKLLDKIGLRESTKGKILSYFLCLLKKYGDFIMGEQTSAFENSDNGLMIMGRPVPPEEFMCPISSTIMFDPVTIATGQTYERMWIQKWFDEGHDTCYKTGMKLTHMSLASNIAMNDLISRWCTEHEVRIYNLRMQPPESLYSWETSLNSVASVGSFLNNQLLEMDLSDISVGSIDDTYS